MNEGFRYKVCVPARNCGKTFFTKLYNTIKEKRDNAQLDYDKTDSYDSLVLKGQIAAYNDVLSLMESMK